VPEAINYSHMAIHKPYCHIPITIWYGNMVYVLPYSVWLESLVLVTDCHIVKGVLKDSWGSYVAGKRGLTAVRGFLAVERQSLLGT
jgi:hypothetical protein